MQQIVFAALENREGISVTIDATDAFLLLCFQYLTHRLSIVVVKSSPVKVRSAIDVEKQQRAIEQRAIGPYPILI